MNPYEIRQFSSDAEVATAAAQAWLQEIRNANQAARPYSIALAGGRIARKFYEAIVTQAEAVRPQFAAVHFFWSDERCLPPTDPESNYRLAEDHLFSPLEIPRANIHRILGEEPPDFAATEAEAEVSRLVELNAAGMPLLDLVVLGLGEDGHVASLFPDAPPAIVTSHRSYLHIENSPKPPACRVTLTYEALAAARRVYVLASGTGKAEALRNSLNPPAMTPLGRVLRARTQTTIFTDISTAAA